MVPVRSRRPLRERPQCEPCYRVGPSAAVGKLREHFSLSATCDFFVVVGTGACAARRRTVRYRSRGLAPTESRSTTLRVPHGASPVRPRGTAMAECIMVVVVAAKLFVVAPLCCQRSAFTGDATRCAGELGCVAFLRASSRHGSAAALAACATICRATLRVA